MEKLIFADFDDTLCLHAYRIDTSKYATYPPDYIAKTAYRDSIPNRLLLEHLRREQQKRGLEIYILTASSSFMLEAKKIWLRSQYPEIAIKRWIGISIDTSKEDIIREYAEKRDAEILFVDDSAKDRAEVEALPFRNIKVYSPQYYAACLCREQATHEENPDSKEKGAGGKP